MIGVVHEPIDDEQTELHICPPLIVVVLAKSMRYPNTRFFNLPHSKHMSYDGAMVTVHHICQFSSTLTWIIVD